MPTTIYTAEEYDAIELKYHAMLSMLDAIFESYSNEHKRRIHKRCNDDDEPIHYPFIPRSSYDLINHFVFLNDHLKKIDKESRDDIYIKFLDVGCGAGNVIMFADSLFRWPFQAHGIERDRKLSLIARQFINPMYDNYIQNMDAFKFKKYGEYDIIYYYCPIQDDELQKKLELLIEKNMKVGAYLIPFLKQDKSFTIDGKFKLIHNDYQIYQKMK